MRFIFFYLTSIVFLSLNPYTGSDKKDDLVETFEIYVNNVQVNSIEARSLRMYSTHHEYKVKLVPTEQGKVSFTLTDIRFRSTINLPRFLFRVNVVGYIEGEKVLPEFHVDESNRNIYVDSTEIYFREIYGGIPVWFNEPVDSIMLTYSNSHGLNLVQYVLLADIRIMHQSDIHPNPTIIATARRDIMLAIDVSTSTSRIDRKNIYRGLKNILGKLNYIDQDSQIAVVNFGTEIYGQYRFGSEKAFKKVYKDLMEEKFDESQEIRYSNWAAPLELALKEKPGILLIVTNGWSNYYNGKPSLFTAHLEDLIELSNKVKAGGTRIIYLTVGFKNGLDKNSMLASLLDGKETEVWQSASLNKPIPDNVDIVSIPEFSKLENVRFDTLVAHVQDKDKESHESWWTNLW